MSRIVALGGGGMVEGENLPIDERIVALTGKDRPRALFVGTASGDDPEKAAEFQRHYGERLGCHTDTLTTLRDRPTADAIAHKFAWADLIYVGGGNSLRMLKLWRRLGIDQLFHAARDRGCVLAGLSAGGLCWFRYGYSASRRYNNPDDFPYIRVRALGYFNAVFCAHAVIEERLEPFREFMRGQTCVGLALDDHCAIEIIDDRWRILRSREDAHAERIWQRRGQLFNEVLTGGNPRPLAELLRR
ncbi:MAG: Type 1 glutamine amidotransferase-like domain-containing protein [Anaerolineaceae bacterium]|nr:Type 1 glutamine amidotransferase-like domain-containing protein [Anaerolineaceae bacterium]